MSREIAVTGATGRVGGRVARLLAEEGVAQRLLVREPRRAPKLPDARVVVADYSDKDALRVGLDGIDTAFLVSAAETPNRLAEHVTFIDAAAAVGVGHLVYLSFQGAGEAATCLAARDHGATEAHIRERGLRYTFVRTSLYADFMPALVGPDGVIRGPAEDGRAAVVAQDDVAACVAAILQEIEGAQGAADHAGETYTLTGPEALTLTQVARVLTEELQRPVRYEPQDLTQARESRAGHGMPAWQIDAWVTTYQAIATGELAQVTGDVSRLTGRRPLTLSQALRG